MSRVRTRPTRDDTRDKLFEAAARVFEEQGIGGASIEAIAAAAGFSRGAFYSNFASKEELIIAMLLALEDGFRLHRLIDPETTPADSFVRAIGDLQRAIGIAFDAR